MFFLFCWTSSCLYVHCVGPSRKNSAWLDAPPPTPEARVSALTPATLSLLREVGAWDRIEAARTCAFDAMQVWDAQGGGHVRYAAREVGELSLGHVVENRAVHTTLHEVAVRVGVETAPPTSVTALDLGAERGGLATVSLEVRMRKEILLLFVQNSVCKPQQTIWQKHDRRPSGGSCTSAWRTLF